MSTILTQEVVSDYVKYMLGSPTVTVELADEQITEATNLALQVYGSARPIIKTGSLQLIAGQQKYTLTAEQVGRGLLRLHPQSYLRLPTTGALGEFDVFRYHTFMPNLDPGDFMMERVWWNEVKRSAGADDDWICEVDPDTGVGTVYVSPPPASSLVAYYESIHSPTLTQVPAAFDQWIKDYTLAVCMEILGRVRNKFSDVPGAEMTIAMDGATLRSDGTQKRKDLEDDLMHRGNIAPPLRG